MKPFPYMLSASSLILAGGIVGAVLLAGAGILLYSRKMQQETKARFYRLLAKLICRHLNGSTPQTPYTESQVEQMLISGKHAGLIPGMHLAKLSVLYAGKGHYDIRVLLYIGTEFTTITVSNLNWVDLPMDIQTAAVNGAGAVCEFILLD